MADVIHFGLNPPDNSGNWVKGLGNTWLPKTLGGSTFTVPSGFQNDTYFTGLLSPTVYSQTLDKLTVNNINNAKAKAKEFGDTAVGGFLNQVLLYGSQFVELATKAKVLINPTLPISYENLDKEALAKANEQGVFDKTYVGTGYRSNNGNNSNGQTNSAFLGIDFSKPLTWVVILVVVIGIKMIFFSQNPEYRPVEVTRRI
ncbi:hypothetical protein VB776_06485 [Arcicella sp. DC2W]|uniref:Uncharacterized protein n=1 Tax=Arcicella gelida TaxID=2984195 RepID=A0ABU5S238_9BACT|nr:hypothetical protein [Arcicella sp. DC2W]MEA5402553.1 hypothetical protein [Arcicella sp. DC2W]